MTETIFLAIGTRGPSNLRLIMSASKSAMLPLVKRPAPAETGRVVRDRGLAAPMRMGGKLFKPSEFELGCEVLVERVHKNKRTPDGVVDQTFVTWCKVVEIKIDSLVVEVPGEENATISMGNLGRVSPGV